MIIEGRGVTRTFGSFTAVDEVSFGLASGEVVGLLGPNGAGKTTLMRMTLGLLRPTEGSILLFSEQPSTRTRSRLGYVPQGDGLYQDLTIAENLAFATRVFGVERPPDLDEELARHAHRLAGELSLGLRRRAAFTAAMAHDPSLLVLDEPTSGVEPLARARLWDTIHTASERGAGVLVSTHYLSEAHQCDRLLIMVGGRLVDSGSPRDIVGAMTVVEVATESWDVAFGALEAAGLVVQLAGRELRVLDTTPARVRSVLEGAAITASVSEQPATLEERFADLVRKTRDAWAQRSA